VLFAPESPLTVRILVSNDGFGDDGGVQSYLEAVVPALSARGHEVALLRRDADHAGQIDPGTWPLFTAAGDDRLSAVREWTPDICFSHNITDLSTDRTLAGIAPVIKFMHGYFGTCVSGQKMFGWPIKRPCTRTFGAACLALYVPRHCGQLIPITLLRHYQHATMQRTLFDRYSALVVASAHMKREYVANGVHASRVHVNTLFAPDGPPGAIDVDPSAPPTVAFVGRMTTLKGGDLLVRAVAAASAQIGAPIRLVMIGGGPQRDRWQRLAARLQVAATFVPWQRGEDRWQWLRGVHLLAVPSTWPEPFGLIGLEAGRQGVPAVAFDVGGVREWLRPGVNGYLVPGDPPRASALAGGIARAFRHPQELALLRGGALRAAADATLAQHIDKLDLLMTRTVMTNAHSAGR
jgi:glycosyltransferase involved in cell wall biosynthesis